VSLAKSEMPIAESMKGPWESTHMGLGPPTSRWA